MSAPKDLRLSVGKDKRRQDVLWQVAAASDLERILLKGSPKLLVIDSRSFLEYNTNHVRDAVNVCCSKLVKRRLQHQKISIKELLLATCDTDVHDYEEVLVYDQCSTAATRLSEDCFLTVLLNKLVKVFHTVSLLDGGFLKFHASHPSLCESKGVPSSSRAPASAASSSSSSQTNKFTTLTSLSQPCMSVTNVGPTKILPFLYLGSQLDALSQDTLKEHGINHILNISTTCPKPHHIIDNHFYRIPVNDNYSDKLLSYFQEAFNYIDQVKEANGAVLVHCLAGISRSPTIAIAYVMKRFSFTSEEAYRFVKEKRPTISPNFNFLGQLMEFEKQQNLVAGRHATVVEELTTPMSRPRDPASPTSAVSPGMKRSFSLHLQPVTRLSSQQSPTTAMASMRFSTAEHPSASKHLKFPHFPTTSLDQLNFTPCFTKNPEDRTSSHEYINHRNKESFLLGSPKYTPETATATTTRLRTSDKTPYARPRSIAGFPYGNWNIGHDYLHNCANNITTNLSDSLQQSPVAPVRNVSSGVCPMDPVPESPTKTTTAQLSRKAQSLEDIVKSQSDNEDDELSTFSRSKSFCSKKYQLAARNDNCPQALTQRNCRGLSDIHQSSSSISSSGSHCSLKGSLELIPVL